MNKRIIAFAFALLAASLAWGQTYSGSRAYDGEHRNIIDGTLLGGQNVVTGWFVGESAVYTRHLTDRWSVSAGEQMQLFKQHYSVDVRVRTGFPSAGPTCISTAASCSAGTTAGR